MQVQTSLVNQAINEFVAHMAGTTLQDYLSTHELGLSQLDEIEKAVLALEVESVNDYKKAFEIKKCLSSLFCYALNNEKGEEVWRKVGKIEDRIGAKMARFVRKYNRSKVKDPVVRAVAKYMATCWNRYYIFEDVDKMIELVKQHGLLYKDSEGNYFITGIGPYAEGDNSFSEDKNGHSYRNYFPVCVFQAFYCNSRWQCILEKRNVEAPPLPDFYCKTLVAPDGRGSVRIYLTSKEKDLIPKKY